MGAETSSTKPEVHNILQCCQRTAEPRPQATCTKHLAKHSTSMSVIFPAAVDSYSILAPNAVPTGFVDGKVASEKVLAALNLGDNYRCGHTKVFFKAGVLGQLEEMREDKLSSIFSNFQARIRGYLIRKNYTKLCDQRWEPLLYDTMRYDTVYLRGLRSWPDHQFNLAHGRDKIEQNQEN